MKKIYFLTTIILLSTAISCKKNFIDLHPQDSLSPETFYQNETQTRQAVVAAYVPLRDLAVNDYFTSEMRSDNTHYQPYPANRGTAYVQRENISDWVDDAINAYTNAVYFHCCLQAAFPDPAIGTGDKSWFNAEPGICFLITKISKKVVFT